MLAGQGVTNVACTPHILPGMYHNTGDDIRGAVNVLQRHIQEAGVEIELHVGADNHVIPDFVSQLARGHLVSLNDSRYVLVEPPHHVLPPRLPEFFFSIVAAGYVPVLTHPERLSWIEDRYSVMTKLNESGVWLQVTSGSLIGRFGKRAKYWAERMICEGMVQILATDAHDCQRRPPDLEQGKACAEKLIGAREAHNLVAERPRNILLDRNPDELPRLTNRDIGSGESGGSDDKIPVHGGRGGLFDRVRRLFDR